MFRFAVILLNPILYFQVTHNYYVSMSGDDQGRHEVHAGRCVFLPRAKGDCIALGPFEKCEDAVLAARHYYEKATGCFFCSSDCRIFEDNLSPDSYEIPG